MLERLVSITSLQKVLTENPAAFNRIALSSHAFFAYLIKFSRFSRCLCYFLMTFFHRGGAFFIKDLRVHSISPLQIIKISLSDRSSLVCKSPHAWQAPPLFDDNHAHCGALCLLKKKKLLSWGICTLKSY